MPISAKLGVGAVVSCLIHYLKPRERAQAQFGQEYALGRVQDLLVESFLPVVPGKPAVCTVYGCLSSVMRIKWNTLRPETFLPLRFIATVFFCHSFDSVSMVTQ